MSTTSSTPMTESKTARKRKAKAASATTPPAESSTDIKVNGEADGESSYLKELAKQIRNTSKKLTAISKTETTIAAHPDTSLDQLLAQKKINADQKAQILKKPQLEVQLAQLEEQQKNFTEFAQELESRFDKEKAATQEAHEAEIRRVKEEATQSGTTESQSKVKEALQIACRFLHAAAFKRQSEDVDQDEGKAYEAVLFYLYQGNSTAEKTLVNVVEGKDEKIIEPNAGEEIDYTFKQLKISAMAVLDGQDATEEQETAQPEAATEAPTTETETDPTIANAGLTELEDTATVRAEELAADTTAVPEQSSTTAEAANAVGGSWNPEASMTTENTQTGEDWVQVPRDPSEVETPAISAAQGSTSNWADEAGAAAAAAEEAVPTPTTENDGFSEVRQDRGGRGRGGHRGRGNLEGRGRGRGRGDFRGRGRGRGGPRGAAAAPQAQAA